MAIWSKRSLILKRSLGVSMRAYYATTQHASSFSDSFILKYDGALSEDQAEFYEENGYLVVKNLIVHDLLDKYKKRFDDICNGLVHIPGLQIMKDISYVKSKYMKGPDPVNKMIDFRNDPELFEYCLLPTILKYVECFTGPNIMCLNSQIVNKPPDPGTKTTRHPFHQDLPYFSLKPANRVVAAWTAMEKSHRDNGCLAVIPGSHKGPVLPHKLPDWRGGVNRDFFGIANYSSDMDSTLLEMEKGDTVFFHPLLIHGSGTNKTNGFRKAICCHYFSEECSFDTKGQTEKNVFSTYTDTIYKLYVQEPGVSREEVWRRKFTPIQRKTSY